VCEGGYDHNFTRFIFRRFFRDFWSIFFVIFLVVIFFGKQGVIRVLAEHTARGNAMRKTPRFSCTQRRSGAVCARTCPTRACQSLLSRSAVTAVNVENVATSHAHRVRNRKLFPASRPFRLGRAGGPKKLFFLTRAARHYNKKIFCLVYRLLSRV